MAVDYYSSFLMNPYGIQNEIVKESDFSSQRVFENTLNAKTFDILRYLLPSNVSTSL